MTDSLHVIRIFFPSYLPVSVIGSRLQTIIDIDYKPFIDSFRIGCPRSLLDYVMRPRFILATKLTGTDTANAIG